MVTAAGPAVQILLGLVLMQMIPRLPQMSPFGAYFLITLMWISIVWALLNLLPVLPLDGGRMLESILGPERIRITLWITVIVASLLAIVSWRATGSILLPIFMGMFAWQAWQALRQRWGVMFQKGGLFSALTVRENVGLPLREHRRLAGRTGQLDDALIDGIAAWKLSLTGLPPDVVGKTPDALSGGMLKRAALARALALDPELLILDEPTSGLDPASAAGIGTLITSTRAQFGPTIVIISHDLELLWRVPDRVAVLGEGRVLAIGPMASLADHPHPLVAAYFDDAQRRCGAAPTDRETAWKTN